MTTNDPTWVSAVPTPDTELETAIVITVPDTDNLQVLVRLPGHIDPDLIAVDFRPTPGASWTPDVLMEGAAVEVRHQ